MNVILMYFAATDLLTDSCGGGISIFVSKTLTAVEPRFLGILIIQKFEITATAF